jgi:hypothetical protein
VSALPEAFPLALAAALYPPALIVLLLLSGGMQPRRLVLAYFLGAAVPTIGTGLLGLAILTGAGATDEQSSGASAGVDIFVGLLLLAFSAWAWQRRTRVAPAAAPEEPAAEPGRIAAWTERAVASQRWAFVLGMAMYLPSPLYLLAVKDIADSGDSGPSNVLAVLICALGVMLFVEVPLVGMYVRPGTITVGLRRFHDWLARNGWTIAAIAALIGGIYAIAKGINALS